MALLGGKLDVLVNNAGSGALKQNLETTTSDDWDKAFNLNLKCYVSPEISSPALYVPEISVFTLPG